MTGLGDAGTAQSIPSCTEAAAGTQGRRSSSNAAVQALSNVCVVVHVYVHATLQFGFSYAVAGIALIAINIQSWCS